MRILNPPSKRTVWTIFISMLEEAGFSLEGDLASYREDLYEDFMEAFMVTKVDPETYLALVIEDLERDGVFDTPMRSSGETVIQSPSG